MHDSSFDIFWMETKEENGPDSEWKTGNLGVRYLSNAKRQAAEIFEEGVVVQVRGKDTGKVYMTIR